MRESLQKWEDPGCTTDDFFASPCPDQDIDAGTSNPKAPNA